jgi:hypothetical protein
LVHLGVLIPSPPRIRTKPGKNSMRKNYLKKIQIVNGKMIPMVTLRSRTDSQPLS